MGNSWVDGCGDNTIQNNYHIYSVLIYVCVSIYIDIVLIISSLHNKILPY